MVIVAREAGCDRFLDDALRGDNERARLLDNIDSPTYVQSPRPLNVPQRFQAPRIVRSLGRAAVQLPRLAVSVLRRFTPVVKSTLVTNNERPQ